MPVFQYEIADRKGAVSRGTAEAVEQTELINRFRERGQVVLSLRETAGSRAAISGIGMESVGEAFRQSFKRMSSGVSLSIFMLFKIVPVFESVYSKAGAVLPLPTRVLIQISNMMRNWLLLVILAVLVLTALLFAVYQTPGGRRFFDTCKLKMPLFGGLIRK